MKDRYSWRGATAVAGTIAILFVGAPAAIASTDDRGERDLTRGVDSTPPPKWSPTSNGGEELVLPPVTGELLEAAGALNDLAEEDPRYNTVEILPDRSGLAIWWYGELSTEVNEFVETAAVAVDVRPSQLLPADLKEAAQKLLSDSEAGITAASIPKDGSALEVSIADRPEARVTPDRLAELAGVPVRVVNVGEPVAARRQNDIYVMGGARVYGFNGSQITGACTTGFPVQQSSTGRTGMMFAAHCGGVGSQWVRYPDYTGGYVYPYGNNGNVVQTVPQYDGAIIETTFNNPGFYVGAWNSSTYTALNGVAFVPVGAEICYSGSFSGLVCGNIVQSTGYRYTLRELPGVTITGIHTIQSAGTPSVGEGDSGGPGYMLANVNGSLKRYAATIISAMPAGTHSTNCTGLSGPPWGGTRQCGPEAISTAVSQIASAAGWTASTVP